MREIQGETINQQKTQDYIQYTCQSKSCLKQSLRWQHIILAIFDSNHQSSDKQKKKTESGSQQRPRGFVK